MSRDAYTSFFVAVAAIFAILATVAHRSGGRWRLWLAWVGSAIVLGVMGVLDWWRLPSKETPLVAYILVAVVPTLAAAAFVQWTGDQRQPLAAQLGGAGAICWVLIPGMLLLGTYGFGG